jgi:predicted AlkP superfamily pyrophosphatase or phosphodiesterase
MRLPTLFRLPLASSIAAAAAICALIATPAFAAPRVVLISLDGATPYLVQEFMRDGTIPHHKGLGLLAHTGTTAERNLTVNPSLTAPAHIAIATGSTAARNDIPANTFHLTASPFISTISGFAAPIGGYSHSGPEESHAPTAEPLWLALRAAGMRVVTATFPGGDGVDIRVPGLAGSPIIQSAAKRTVDYTVPFGAFGGVGASGFVLSASSFAPAPAATLAQLAAAGRTSFSPVLQTPAPIETFTAGGATFRILIAALDTTNDGVTNYDTLAIFDQTRGIQPGPFALPSTGPAYVKASERRSSLFFLDGSATRAGLAFYVSRLEPDLSAVHVGRYSANFIPRNAPVLADVDDINDHVGFWVPQPDFRIPERLSPGFGAFDDLELEAMYQDQVRSFVEYQTRVALRAIERNPDADLVMMYIEQPDGSGHQFLMTDPRQASTPRDPASIGANQDPAKRARYMGYLRNAYRVANEAVQRVIDAVGTNRHGTPTSDVIVVSDHGFAPFHTAVNMSAFLASKGFDPAKVRAITSGPTANIYISLQGREPNGTVSAGEYLTLQQQLVKALREFADVNPNYAMHRRSMPIFDQVFARPSPASSADPQFGLGTSRVIGQDSGDVYATLSLGYNFDGTQSPVVARLGDDAAAATIVSVPNFYGAHGYDPRLREMSAIFFAAGPHVCRDKLEQVRNIDIAPTILAILGVRPADTVQGRAIKLCGKDDHDRRGRGHDDEDDD